MDWIQASGTWKKFRVFTSLRVLWRDTYWFSTVDLTLRRYWSVISNNNIIRIINISETVEVTVSGTTSSITPVVVKTVTKWVEIIGIQLDIPWVFCVCFGCHWKTVQTNPIGRTSSSYVVRRRFRVERYGPVSWFTTPHTLLTLWRTVS